MYCRVAPYCRCPVPEKEEIPRYVHCTVGWVNLYQKFEIEKYTVCGKLILPKKMERHFWHNWLANLHGFANICKLPVSNTFKDMHSKI